MAQACACDRCGTFFVVKHNVDSNNGRRYVICDNNDRYLRNGIDLCDDCYKELEQFMNQSRNSQTL